MTDLSDMLLSRPIGDELARWLLFFIFTAHLLFILILIGSAIIGHATFLHSFWTREKFELRWDKKMLKVMIVPKAIGVVLGVGVLLLTQVHLSVPFYTATAIFAPYWLAVILMMIVAFLLLESISHMLEVHPILSLALGSAGLITLLGVPAVFVAVLVATENSDRWLLIVENDYRFTSEMIFHWLFRYLHVIAGGVVFGAAFQYFVSTEEKEYRKKELTNWMLGGLLAQFVIGGALAMSMRGWITGWAYVPLATGILAAVVLVWLLWERATPFKTVEPMTLVVLLPIVAAGMLLTRQFVQNERILPVLAKVSQNAEVYRARLQLQNPQPVAALATKLSVVYDNGATIFERSCTFCHGLDGSGDGPDGRKLSVPPERISQLRVSREYLYDKLVSGVPGSGMPYFTIFDRYKIESLIEYLDERFQILSSPDHVPTAVSPQDKATAEEIYSQTCILCHGTDGRGTDYARPFRPGPPDFTHFGLTPQRAFEVVTRGYPGTAMQPFGELPDSVRWGLVEKALAWRSTIRFRHDTDDK